MKKSYEQKEKARVYHDVEDMYQHFELIGGNLKDKSLENMIAQLASYMSELNYSMNKV